MTRQLQAADVDPAFSCLTTMRDAELLAVRKYLPPTGRILELGGGSGYQAQVLASWGYDVTSIDLASREPSQRNFHPVIDYDGHRIPAPDASFDVVFSSNVLEHVPHLESMLAETRRVLRPGGRMVHVLPSSAWRFWASAGFFPYAVGYALGRRPSSVEEKSVRTSVAKRGPLRTALRALAVPLRPHGEYPNALAELYYFSAFRWRRVFRRAGFVVNEAHPVRLFYTPYKMLHDRLQLPTRRALSRVFGSACNVFVLTVR